MRADQVILELMMFLPQRCSICGAAATKRVVLHSGLTKSGLVMFCDRHAKVDDLRPTRQTADAPQDTECAQLVRACHELLAMSCWTPSGKAAPLVVARWGRDVQ